jgi:hypothetical protein
VSLAEIRNVVKEASFRYPNVFIYDEDEDLPPLLFAALKVITRLIRILGSGQPMWRVFIAVRRMQFALSIKRIQFWFWKRRCGIT